MRVRRSASAWARPRPSAIASAKLANSTVNHSQAASWPVNEASPPAQQIADEQYRDERRHDGGDEDHRIANEMARIELGERVDGGAPDRAHGSVTALA